MLVEVAVPGTVRALPPRCYYDRQILTLMRGEIDLDVKQGREFETACIVSETPKAKPITVRFDGLHFYRKVGFDGLDPLNLAHYLGEKGYSKAFKNRFDDKKPIILDKNTWPDPNRLSVNNLLSAAHFSTFVDATQIVSEDGPFYELTATKIDLEELENEFSSLPNRLCLFEGNFWIRCHEPHYTLEQLRDKAILRTSMSEPLRTHCAISALEPTLARAEFDRLNPRDILLEFPEIDIVLPSAFFPAEEYHLKNIFSASSAIVASFANWMTSTASRESEFLSVKTDIFQAWCRLRDFVDGDLGKLDLDCCVRDIDIVSSYLSNRHALVHQLKSHLHLLAGSLTAWEDRSVNVQSVNNNVPPFFS